jgi:hypothetical protein
MFASGVKSSGGGGDTWTSRGDVGGVDFQEILYSGGTDVLEQDISAVVGVAAKLVLLSLYMDGYTTGDFIRFRTNGFTTLYNVSRADCINARDIVIKDMWVMTDADGKFDLLANYAGQLHYYYTVRGWWTPSA